MFILADRVKQTSLTEGSGAIVFNGTFGSFQPFSVIGSGNSTFYTIENASNFEIGVGTYNSFNNSLSRDTILDSSNSGQKININGLSTVFCTYPADRSVFLNEQGYIYPQQTFYSGIKFPDNTIQTSAGVQASGSTLSSCTFINSNIFYRTSAGCFFHAYVDNAHDDMVALHSTDEVDPAWTLGVKPYSTSFSAAPTISYVYGKNGTVGAYTNNQNGMFVNFTNGFWVKHRNTDILNVDRNNGVVIYHAVPTRIPLRVTGASAQSSNLQTWENFTYTVVASMSPAGILSCSGVNFPGNRLQTKAYVESHKNVSSSQTLLSTDDVVLVDCSIANVSLTLPSAVNLSGKKIIIKRKTGNFNLNILPTGSQTIDGQSSFSILHNYQAITVVSDNSNWFII